MKNYQASKITKWSLLFLAISFLTIANTFISKAQSQATTPNLEGTGWRVVTTNLYPTASIVPPEVVYVFEGQGVTISIDSDPLGIDPVGIPRVRTSARGTYSQSGNSVHIEFSDHVIDAKIEGDSLIGEFKLKASGGKAKWTAIGQLTNKSNRTNQTPNISNTTSSSFSVSTSNAFLGVWKYSEYTGGIDAGGIKIPPKVTKIITFTFNQNGVSLKSQSAVYGDISYLGNNDKLNWKYVPQTDLTGVLEQYEENKLVYKNNIRWIDNNQFEVSGGDGKGLIFKREGNNPNNYKSLNESVNIPPPNPSSSLSMKERLPAQLGQFKLIFFSDNCITPAFKIAMEREEAEAQAKGEVMVGDPTMSYSQWIEKPCSKGEIEIAGASYRDTANCNWLFCIYVSIEKYEDSGKATQAMANEITKMSYLGVIKRQPFKNDAGQTVGELVLLQSPKLERENVIFTFGTYFYSISSPKRGEAQNALKFLPLETGIMGRTGPLKGR
jgi:hypothetical protein